MPPDERLSHRTRGAHGGTRRRPHDRGPARRQVVRRAARPARRLDACRSWRGRRRHRSIGKRQEHAPTLREPARVGAEGRGDGRRPRGRRREARRQRSAHRDRSCVPALQPLSAHERDGEPRPRADEGPAPRPPTAEARAEAARAHGPVRQGGRQPPALGRPTAARGHCPGAACSRRPCSSTR